MGTGDDGRWRDPERMLRAQYATPGNLAARLALHQRFGTNAYPFPRWVFDRVLAERPRRVLEVGCGPATLWAANLDRIPRGLELELTDGSAGMVEAARAAVAGRIPGVALREALVDALPFEAGRFDLVLANHMLYHAPDLSRAVRELARVLEEGGVLLATTNGASHMLELEEALRAVGVPDADLGRSVIATFHLENGAAALAEAFGDVRLERYVDALHVTDVEAIVAYARSLGAEALRGEEALRRFRAGFEARIAAEGFVSIRKDAGIFRARR